MKIADLKNKLSFLEKLDDKKMAAILGICFLLLVLDLGVVLKMQFRQIASVGKKAAKVKNDIRALMKDMAMMRGAKSKPKVSADIKIQRLISEEEIPRLLQDISAIANKNNVKIMQIKTAKEAGPADKKSPIAASLNNYPLSINMELFAGYHQFGSFLAQINSSSVYMSVKDFKIYPDYANYLQQKISLTLEAYVKK